MQNSERIMVRIGENMWLILLAEIFEKGAYFVHMKIELILASVHAKTKNAGGNYSLPPTPWINGKMLCMSEEYF
jgi:hypothetical protein